MIQLFRRTVSYPAFFQFVNTPVAKSTTSQEDLYKTAAHTLFEKLPAAHKEILQITLLHLKKVAVTSGNEMGVENLATVFAPSLVAQEGLDLELQVIMNEAAKRLLVCFLAENCFVSNKIKNL
jgi:glutamine synthetase type III